MSKKMLVLVLLAILATIVLTGCGIQTPPPEAGTKYNITQNKVTIYGYPPNDVSDPDKICDITLNGTFTISTYKGNSYKDVGIIPERWVFGYSRPECVGWVKLSLIAK